MEIFAVDKLAGQEEPVLIEADATLSAVKRQCGGAFGFGDDVELSVGGQRVACGDGEAVSSIAAFSGGCRVEVAHGVRGFVEQLRSGDTTVDDIPVWARLRRECVLAAMECYHTEAFQKLIPMLTSVGKGKKQFHFAQHWVPPSLYGDKEVMQQFVRIFPDCLPLASPALRRDSDVVLASMGRRFNGQTAELPDMEMWMKEKVFVMGALECGKIVFDDISPSLRDDKDVVMQAMNPVAGGANDYDPDCLYDQLTDAVNLSDRKVLDEICCCDKLRYRDLSTSLRGDKEVALKAIGSFRAVWFEFQHMSEELRGDKEVVMQAIQVGGARAVDAVQHMSESLRADKALALEALGQHGGSLQHMSMSLRGDKGFAMMAVERNPRAFQYLSEQLRGDKEVAMLTLKSDDLDPGLIQHMSETLRGDEEVVLRALMRDSKAYQHITDVLRNDKGFTLRLVAGNDGGSYFPSLPDALRDDLQVALPAIRLRVENFMYAGEHVRGDKEAALAAFSCPSRTALLAFASADLQADREVGTVAVGANPKNASYTSPF